MTEPIEDVVKRLRTAGPGDVVADGVVLRLRAANGVAWVPFEPPAPQTEAENRNNEDPPRG